VTSDLESDRRAEGVGVTAPTPPFFVYSEDMAGNPKEYRVERATKTQWVCSDGTRWNKRTREMVGRVGGWASPRIVIPGDDFYERCQGRYREFYRRMQANHWLEIARREREDDRALESARNAVRLLEALVRNKTTPESEPSEGHPRTKETP